MILASRKIPLPLDNLSSERRYRPQSAVNAMLVDLCQPFLSSTGHCVRGIDHPQRFQNARLQVRVEPQTGQHLNHATEKAYGLPYEQIVGRTVEEILGVEQAQLPLERMRVCIATGENQRYTARRTLAGVTRSISRSAFTRAGRFKLCNVLRHTTASKLWSGNGSSSWMSPT